MCVDCRQTGAEPQLDFLDNSNSGIGIGIELAYCSRSGIELELPSLEFELESELRSMENYWIQNCLPWNCNLIQSPSCNLHNTIL